MGVNQYPQYRSPISESHTNALSFLNPSAAFLPPLQSQPPGSVNGSFRITEQGEMVQAKFGTPAVAQYTM